MTYNHKYEGRNEISAKGPKINMTDDEMSNVRNNL